MVSEFSSFAITGYFTPKADISFRREPVCAEGYTEGDTWVCTKYFSDERDGFVTITNPGGAARFTTSIEGWLYLEGARHAAIHNTQKEWTDDFGAGASRVYTFTYMVPISGMSLDSRFFIKVYNPDGSIMADEVFVTSL